MVSFSTIRAVGVYLWDSLFKGKTLKEALQENPGQVFIYFWALGATFLAIHLGGLQNYYRKSAIHNKEEYHKLLEQHNETKKKLVTSLISYDKLYHMHYDHKGNLIIHDPQTGLQVGVLKSNDFVPSSPLNMNAGSPDMDTQEERDFALKYLEQRGSQYAKEEQELKALENDYSASAVQRKLEIDRRRQDAAEKQAASDALRH